MTAPHPPVPPLVTSVAPLASEAPALLAAGRFAWRLDPNAALGPLVPSKVDQWTLHVGALPIVSAISSGTRPGLPLGALLLQGRRAIPRPLRDGFRTPDGELAADPVPA